MKKLICILTAVILAIQSFSAFAEVPITEEELDTLSLTDLITLSDYVTRAISRAKYRIKQGEDAEIASMTVEDATVHAAALAETSVVSFDSYLINEENHAHVYFYIPEDMEMNMASLKMFTESGVKFNKYLNPNKKVQMTFFHVMQKQRDNHGALKNSPIFQLNLSGINADKTDFDYLLANIESKVNVALLAFDDVIVFDDNLRGLFGR